MPRGRSAVLAALCASISGALALPAAANAHTSVIEAGPAAASLARTAAVIGGSRWPGRPVARITYFNASSAKWHVRQAVRAWNTSGARVRFVPVARRRAKVVITDGKGPASDQGMWGFASIGYIYPGGGFVRLSRLAHPRQPNYSMAGVATHELGHVLGLDHEDGNCATMNTSLWAACRGARSCSLLERDDINGAVKLYGGRVRMVTPPFCPKPPSSIRATGDPRAYGVTLAWENPRSVFFDRVQVARGRGSCPRTRPQGGQAATGKPGAAGRFVDRDFVSGTGLATGRYCYALWSVGNPNIASRRRTVWVDFNPQRPAAPTDLRAVPGPSGTVALSWKASPHPELEGIEGSAALGRCPTSPAGEDYAFSGTEGTADPLQLWAPGRYCFVAWARDSIGAYIGPSEPVWLDYRGAPPAADFSEYANLLTVDFFDQSYDADGDEIVSRRWEFGDGSVREGNEANVSHEYTAAGTYTVRLTVVDANGLSGTTTREVTVSDY